MAEGVNETFLPCKRCSQMPTITDYGSAGWNYWVECPTKCQGMKHASILGPDHLLVRQPIQEILPELILRWNWLQTNPHHLTRFDTN